MWITYQIWKKLNFNKGERLLVDTVVVDVVVGDSVVVVVVLVVVGGVVVVGVVVVGVVVVDVLVEAKNKPVKHLSDTRNIQTIISSLCIQHLFYKPTYKQATQLVRTGRQLMFCGS